MAKGFRAEATDPRAVTADVRVRRSSRAYLARRVIDMARPIQASTREIIDNVVRYEYHETKAMEMVMH